MNNEKFIVALLAIAFIGAALLAFFSIAGFFAPKLENNAANFQQFASQANPEDVCAVPAGTDPVQWREHLSHHPDLYSQCLK